MGVNLYLLDRRAATLFIGGREYVVGTLRRFFKLTELDAERMAARDAAARIKPSPTAVLITEISDFPLAGDPQKSVAAHLILGWDEDRSSVTDSGWDYLPRLGYGVRHAGSGKYTLHEEYSGLLSEINAVRARELGVLDGEGNLIRRGQPRIAVCKSVRPYIPGWVEVDCSFDSGLNEKLLVATSRADIPPSDWFAGKRPMDVESYLSGDKEPHP